MFQKKVCMLGATGVGKTSLIRQFVEGFFSEKYLTTIGVKIDKKQIRVNSTDVQLMLWDLEGIDRYCGFKPRYLRGASAIFIVMDRSRAQSLVEGMEILEMVREHTDIPAIMVINKCDLSEAWHWDTDHVNLQAERFAATYYTSAKTGENVEAMFEKIAELSLN
ncbi:Rab family GTPase [Alteromonas flava]|uniref:Rab family GTPase n=1 Tax=Alteromonas flava TaxID=2048003 RepID=UPI000C29559C|nr:Rab family GTPase [Alteromonas flava]